MFVIKRDGRKETTKFDKILRRITRLCKDLKNVDGHVIAQKVILGLFDGVSSRELDRLAIEQAYSMSVQHPDYDKLALKLAISSLHKDTADTFSECIEKLYNAKDPFGNPKSVIAEDVYKIVKKNAHILNAAIDYNRDYNFDYFGFRTLEKSYLLKINEWDTDGNHYKITAERPQHLFMRVAIGVHKNDVEAAINTYEMLSTFQATHATPTLFNAGTVKNQCFSCYLQAMKDDSITGIYDTLKESALISQSAGGIGVHIHNIRAKGSPIYGTGGVSNGIIPMLKNFNETMRYVDQCFAGDTEIFTAKGLKKISEVIVGDLVFGSSGNLNEVKKILTKSVKEKIIELNVAGQIVHVRHMHPFLGIITSGEGKNLLKDKLDKKLLEPEWIDAENISRLCWIATTLADLLNPYISLNPDHMFKHGDFYYYKVNSISETEFEGEVYDLEVEPDHDYVTPVGIAHNGGGKRKGSAAIYLEPWHADIFEFLDLRKNNGKEELRARDLNLAIWAPDLFFKRVKEDGNWTLMDPNRCKGLSDIYGEEFDKLYIEYEEKKFGERVVKARDLWSKILESCIETGQPYLLAKDACNMKSNQKNLGTVKSSNLCAEIIEYSDPEEVAVCCLASVSLPACIDGKKNKKFNFEKLEATVATLTENLNKLIDINYYPVETSKRSNLRHRPIGIGVQGLGTLFAQLRLSWESEEAKQLNKNIFETMYYAFLKKSNELAKKSKTTYETYPGSPLSEGIFQFEMWGFKPSERHDWEALRKSIKKYGVINSLGIAQMPTASTSQVLGNSECIEPITSNIYKRSTLSGEFVQVNKYLVQDLMDLEIWSEELRQLIIAHNGSIQNINMIPDDIKKLYKTVWEISQKILIDMSADRAPFICQSQSLNLYFENANFAKLSSAYMYGWEKGLKTIVYYTRTKAAREAIKFTVDTDIEEKNKKVEEEENIACSLDNPEGCEACGS